MRTALAWLVFAGLAIAAFVHYGAHLTKLTQVVAAQQPQAASSTPAPGQDSGKMITMAGPPAQWMQNQKPDQAPEERRVGKPHPSDHIAASPVGTSSAIIRKTFAVSAPAKFSFEVPAHGASPQLHGTFRSFVRQGGIQSSDESADVDLLLMNGEQFAGFLRGQPADTVYSVDSSHDQDVSLGLPATMDHPVQYYLVFRNSSSSAAKKIVQADFRVDF